MVFPDISEKNSSQKIGTASPQDRFLALAFDAVLCGPILFAILKPFWKKIQYLSMTASDSTELKALVFLTLGLGIFILLTAQTLFLWRKGWTPGLRIFRMSVVSTNSNQHPSLGQCALRSLVWLLEILCLGLPLLECFSHPKRFCWHDRISETQVVSLTNSGGDSPHAIERHFFRNIYWAAVSVVAFVFISNFSNLFRHIRRGDYRKQELVEQGYLCSAVTEEMPKSSNDTQMDRVDFVMGLNQLGLMSKECLESEIDFLAWTDLDEGPAWVQWARQWIRSEGDRSRIDLSLICEEPSSKACAIAKWYVTGVGEDKISDSWFVRLRRAKDLVLGGDYQELKTHLLAYQWPESLLSFVQSRLLQAQWMTESPENFQSSFAAVSTGWSPSLRQDMGAWACMADLLKSCQVGKTPASCEFLRAETKMTVSWSAPITLALWREAQCSVRKDKNFEHQAQKVFSGPDQDWVLLTQGLNPKFSEIKTWWAVLKSTESLEREDWLFPQALNYLVLTAKSSDQILAVRQQMDRGPSEDFFWWIAKRRFDFENPTLPSRVPTSEKPNNESSSDEDL